MAEGVVDELEAVEVEHQHGDAAFFLLRATAAWLLQHVTEPRPVRQSRSRIGEGESA